MSKRILGLVKAKDSKTKNSLQKEKDSNEEVIARIKSTVQKSIEKYGMPDSSKMEKKLYFIDPSKYFKRQD